MIEENVFPFRRQGLYPVDPKSRCRPRFERLEERRLLAVTAGCPSLGTSPVPPAPAGDETPPATWLVTTASDTAGDHEGLLSLREAIESAQAGDRVTFAPALSGKTITLSGKELSLSVSLTIDASDLKKGITIDANNQSRLFSIAEGAEVSLVNLRISGGKENVSGGGIQNAGILTLTGCAVVNNSAARGGGIENSGSLTLLNCTVAGNSADHYGGGICVSAGSITVKNSIVAENKAGSGGNDLRKEEGATVSASYSLSSFTDWTESDHLVEYNANRQIFSDAANGIYTLAANSQALDVGNNAFVVSEKDLAGAARVQHLIVDLGAYEAGISSSVQIAGWSAEYDGEEHEPEIEGVQEGDTVEYSLDGGATFTETPPAFVEMGAYPLTVRVSRPQYEPYSFSGEYEVREVPSSIVTTLDDVLNAVDGQISLRDAIGYTPAGGTITFTKDLAGKTITLAGQELAITEPLVIDASDLDGKLTIDAGGAGRVLTVSGGTAAKPVELIGLVITGGTSAENGGGICAQNAVLKLTDCTVTANTAQVGGGLYCEGGTAILANCLFEKNSALSGGGLGLQNTAATVSETQFLSNTALYYYGGAIENIAGSLTVTSCTFSKNSAGNGGAIDVDRGTLSIVSCIISENTALRRLNAGDGYYYGGYGGGVYNYRGEVSLSNCAITQNEASNWGGGIESYGNMSLLNCTLASNRAAYGGGIDVDAGSKGKVGIYNSIVALNTAYAESDDVNLSSGSVSAYYTLSSFEEWTESESPYSFDGLTSIFTDPGNGKYTLRKGSRCVNGGSNSYVTVSADLAGNTRIVGGRVDLGAYEIQDSPGKLAAPVILSGTGELSAAYGLGQQRIAWSSVDNASGYELSYTENGVWWTSMAVEETSRVISNLKNGTLVQYKVRALGDTDHYESSEWSEVKSFYVCPFDIDGDGAVGAGDYSAMQDAWLTLTEGENWDPRCDIDGDGFIGPGDYALLSANWLKDADFVYPAG